VSSEWLKLAKDRFESLGHLIIPDQPFSIPEQTFVFRRVGDTIIVESQPTNSWPTIYIEFSSNLEGRDFALHLADGSVDGWLLYTRVSFLLAKAGAFSILADSGDEIGSRFEIDLDKKFFQLARICRKLKFIENVFNLKFSLPDVFSSEDLSNLEIVFRGITQGEFSVRASDFTFPSILSSEIDLTKPPFEGCGSFSHTIGDQITLFGQRLPVGSVTVHLEKAAMGSLKVVEHIRKGSKEPVDVRFEVLDNQIVYRFEDYVRQPREHFIQQLERFKKQLALEEPKELVDLIDESLQKDVSSEEALQIAMGWTQYNDLPDRFCPQDPEIDPTTGHWRVPVCLVYASGEGGPVGEIIIDKKTGIIISQTPLEDMHSRASSLINEYDEEVLTTARKFMDRHDKLLRRLAE
jgi:hypothetical protein